MISAFESSTATPEIEADRRRALRALLRYPMLTATGETSEDYIRVRRHSECLKDWLAKFPAWGLHIDKEVVRLRKIPPDLQDDTRPAIDRVSGTAFSRRRYALLCLVLAALEEADAQTTIGRIAVKIMQFVHADRDLQAAGIILDIENYDQRRDLGMQSLGPFLGTSDWRKISKTFDIPASAREGIFRIGVDVAGKAA